VDTEPSCHRGALGVLGLLALVIGQLDGASLEGRAPFLDHHLVEFACRLPAALKLRGPIGKRVLRRAVASSSSVPIRMR